MDTYKIPVNRWDYKLTKEFNINGLRKAKDFCSYWRSFTWALIKFIGVVSALLILGVGLAFLFIVAPIGWFIFDVESFRSVGIQGFAVGTMITVLLGLSIMIEKIKKAMRQRAERQTFHEDDEVSEREPNIFVQKYRAWKSKVCPVVEFVDE